MKNIVVFGATGNIGVYLVDYLHENLRSDEYKVIASGRRRTDYFFNKGIAYVKCDITEGADFELLPQSDVYAVINLAGVLPAYTNDLSPYPYIKTNIYGGVRILEYAKNVEADRVLYSTTWADQAGYWGKETMLSPEMPTRFAYKGDHAFYAITKSMIIETMEYYKQEYGLKNYVFRLPNVYMWTPDKYYFVDGKRREIGYRYMIDRAERGLPIEMWGNPKAFKDILYIKDLCQMMHKALFSTNDGGIYNAGTGIKTSLEEQINGIIEVFSPYGNKSEVIPMPNKSSFVSFVMDIENAKRDLGYEPEYDYIAYLEDYKKEKFVNRFVGL